MAARRPSAAQQPQSVERRPVAGGPVGEQVVEYRVELLLGRVPGLEEVLVEADLVDRSNGDVGVGVGGQQDALRLGLERERLGEELGAGHRRHALVDEEQRHRIVALGQLAHDLERVGPGAGADDAVVVRVARAQVALDGPQDGRRRRRPRGLPAWRPWRECTDGEALRCEHVGAGHDAPDRQRPPGAGRALAVGDPGPRRADRVGRLPRRRAIRRRSASTLARPWSRPASSTATPTRSSPAIGPMRPPPASRARRTPAAASCAPSPPRAPPTTPPSRRCARLACALPSLPARRRSSASPATGCRSTRSCATSASSGASAERLPVRVVATLPRCARRPRGMSAPPSTRRTSPTR